jgi:predicted TIM-barrel fold metal-dependent hydrolase
MADCPVDHPAELDKLIALQRYPKVFVKISHTWSLSKQDYPWLDSQALVRRLYDSFGPKRLMWATDWPIAKEKATYVKRLDVIRSGMTFLNDEDKRWLLSETPRKVWPF